MSCRSRTPATLKTEPLARTFDSFLFSHKLLQQGTPSKMLQERQTASYCYFDFRVSFLNSHQVFFVKNFHRGEGAFLVNLMITTTQRHKQPGLVCLFFVDLCVFPKNNGNCTHKKRNFPLRISSVKVSKSAENCGFGHNY